MALRLRKIIFMPFRRTFATAAGEDADRVYAGNLMTSLRRRMFWSCVAVRLAVNINILV